MKQHEARAFLPTRGNADGGSLLRAHTQWLRRHNGRCRGLSVNRRAHLSALCIPATSTGRLRSQGRASKSRLAIDLFLFLFRRRRTGNYAILWEIFSRSPKSALLLNGQRDRDSAASRRPPNDCLQPPWSIEAHQAVFGWPNALHSLCDPLGRQASFERTRNTPLRGLVI